MDRATVLGLAATCGLIVWVLLTGAGWEAGAFWQTPSVALVLGGAVLTTLMSCPVSSRDAIRGLLRNAFFVRTRPADELVVLIVALAEVARRDGLLALDRPVAALKDAFLKKAFEMTIDGAEPGAVEAVLRAEMESTDLRHTYGVRMLESMGRSAPVFGMIGTVIGLVIMLGRMNDPSRIGPGMAVALLTTLYGLVLANVFFLPLSRKLAHRSSEELLSMTIALRGVLAIQAGDNPRIVEQKLRAYLPAGAFGAASVARSVATSGVVRDLAGRNEGKKDAIEPRASRASSPAPAAAEQEQDPTTLDWINSLVAADLLSSELKTIDGKPVGEGEGPNRRGGRGRKSVVEEAA
ncbi:MAG TPA: MotA/TolQ/ExbB proton channel family protein [Phycisphaerae bacterium]|nr:MotA/TolQ/ExbB proton channel family protein [Phycisphaerae bacterium]